MKIRIIFGLVLCMMIFGLSEVKAVSVDVEISGDSQVKVGDTISLTAKYITSNDLVDPSTGSTGGSTEEDVTNRATWKSANNEIATVDNKGNVKGIKVGETTISASYSGQTSSDYRIKVIPSSSSELRFKINIIGVNNGNGEYSVPLDNTYVVGEKLGLSASLIEYSNGETAYGNVIKDNIKANWTSSDSSIASVDSNGVVTFKGKGRVVISASYTYNGKLYSDKLELKVSDEVAKPDEEQPKKEDGIVGKQTTINPPTGIASIVFYSVVVAIITGSVLYLKRSKLN